MGRHDIHWDKCCYKVGANTHHLIMNLVSLHYRSIWFCFSVRVSNELGAGRPRATMYAVIVVMGTSLAIGLLSMVGILVLRECFPVIFTSDKDLQRAVSNIAGLLGVTMVLNSIQPVISGVCVSDRAVFCFNLTKIFFSFLFFLSLFKLQSDSIIG